MGSLSPVLFDIEKLKFQRSKITLSSSYFKNVFQIMCSTLDPGPGRRTAQEHVKTLGYRFVGRLGEGTFSKVYLTEYVPPGTTDVQKLACKLIDTATCSAKFKKKFLPRELAILLRVHHPHIIGIHAIVKCHSKVFIFMRYAEEGDLLTYILANGPIDENRSRVWARQMALALQYLHEAGIAHRDLKCENILITSNFNVKMSDFGFARHVARTDTMAELCKTFCGSFDYASPEVLKGEPYNAKVSDMWSYGVLLYVMLNKSIPFKGKTKAVYDQQMAQKWQFRSRVRHKLSDQAKAIIGNLLEPNPSIRWTVTDVLICDWFVENPKLRTLTPDECSALTEARSITGGSNDISVVKSKLKVSDSDVVTIIKDIDERVLDQVGSNVSVRDDVLDDLFG
ncbi:testis-specific serine/threonine-protein kinase 3-like [Toxorhynchites rutilus septentrionalis]|uniref:testis-specific serine/threonine-protein kinase 3-like n=1 Tax=Toxorhynchites rutilus septentrionalis TaxID=329112 RepID=UPI0024791DC2|nr:testis-specific serine/threonine-protein kinase 3-like [Toxorhynchites rutilus septentrionalis]